MTRATAATVAVIGITACDAATPREEIVVSEPVEPAPPETLSDILRDALAEIVLDKDPYSRARRLATLLPDAGPAGVAAAQATLEDSGFLLGPTEIGLLLRYWATYEGHEASYWAAKQASIAYRSAALLEAISAWAEVDPKTASSVTWDWPAGDPNFERVVPIAIVRGWRASDDPEGVVAFLRGQPLGFFRQRGIWAYINILIDEGGVDSALAWMHSIPDDDENSSFKLDAYRRVVSVISSRDVQAGVRFCELHCEGPYGSNVRSIVAGAWVRSGDGAAALNWLSTAPEGFERDVAVKGTFLDWLIADRKAAFEWIGAESVGEPKPWLQAAYPVYVVNLARDAPPDAIERAARIVNDWDREAALIEITRIWRGRDEAAAEAWLLESSLSEKAREKARKPIKRVRGFTRQSPEELVPAPPPDEG